MGMFDDRVLLLWFVGVLVLGLAFLGGLAAGSLANTLLVGTWVVAGLVWWLVR